MTDFRTVWVDGSGRENRRSKVSELGSDRDPSFSGWCDEDEPDHPPRFEKKDVFQEHFNFALPLVQQHFPKNIEFDNKKSSSNNFLERMELGGSVHDEPPDDSDPLMVDDGYKSSPNSFDSADFRNSSENAISVVYVVKTLCVILIWYTVSTLLTLYNKTLLGDDMGRFPAPLLMNTIHFAMQATLSMVITRFWYCRHHSSVMSWQDYFAKVVPMAIGTALDIDLSNASLVFISVTFATMCKSASPIFLLLFAFAFRLESPSIRLVGIILIISTGVLLTVAREAEFSFWGFVLVMLAAVMSGFRWAMTQILLQKEVYGLKNPLTLMNYVAPVMTIATAVLSMLLDPWDEFKMSNYFNSSWHIAKSFLLMSFGGTLAFIMVLAEYILVSVTSAVTVTIAGVMKEVVTIMVAVLYFHDEFNWLKGVGLVISVTGVSLFNWYKYQKLLRAKNGVDVGSPTSKYTILEQSDKEEDNL